MTDSQRAYIIRLRKQGKSYAEISSESGIARSTISTYFQKYPVKNLLYAPSRGNTLPAEGLENKRIAGCSVTLTFAEEPNNAAVAEALRILTNAG